MPGFALVDSSEWSKKLKSYGMPERSYWRPEKFEISSLVVEHQIVTLSIAYRQLRLLTCFRGKNGLNETQWLGKSDEQTAENDSIYPLNVWPCGESVVKGLGLGGEVKDVRIQ